MSRTITALLMAAAVLPVATGSLAAAERPAWVFSVGTFDTASEEFLLEAGLEYRRPLGRLGLDWAAGMSATEAESYWAYLGLRRDVSLTPRWTLTPGFAVSLYEKGDGKDLGGPVEFRSSIEVFAGVSPRMEVGVSFYHLSHAGLYEDNPGSNSLVLMLRYGL